MLKANAYGHGAVEIARASVDIANWFGVANAEEGLKLRLYDIHKPILVTVFSKEDSELVVKYNLIPIIYNKEQIEELDKYGKLYNKVIDIHIKIDTGMNRLGVKSLQEFNEIINTIKCLSNINLQGICTHFYDNNLNTLRKQKAIFDRFTYNYKKLILHSASSNAIEIGTDYHYDLVRVGISAYGYSDYCNKYQPVMSVLSKVIAIKNISAYETAGYSANFRAYKDTRLAIIRGGYYDGIIRDMVGAKVIIRNTLATIVAICMDMSIVDVGSTPVNINDDVIIMGSLADKKISARELSDHCKTIPYEILTNIKGRIERIYYD